MPNCEPLDTLVKIELPNDVGHVEKFIPSHVLIPRCSGLHSGTCESLHYHSSATKCISSSKRNREVKVDDIENIILFVRTKIWLS